MNIAYLLCEALKDISTENKLYHRTNLEGLVGILYSGMLNGFDYGHRKAINSYKTDEIATARKATFTSLDKGGKHSDLSGSIGSFQIELYVDRIRASVRNNKIVPIAEFNVINKRKLETDLRKIIVYEKQNEIEHIANELIKNRVTDTKEFLKKKFPNYIRLAISKPNFDEINSDLKQNKKVSSIAREGEERINLPSGKGIPVDPLLMNIKILPTFKEDFKQYALEFSTLSSLKKLSKLRTSAVLVKDDTYNRFFSFVEGAKRALGKGLDSLLDYYNVEEADRKYIKFNKTTSKNVSSKS